MPPSGRAFRGGAGGEELLELGSARGTLGLERGSQLRRHPLDDRVEVAHGHASALVPKRAAILIFLVVIHRRLPLRVD
jgi:hypothetical protein